MASRAIASPPPHRFDHSCSVEARWAPTLDAWLSAAYALRPATSAEQWRGIDRVAIDDDGHPVSLDYKCDERCAQTGNVFIEIVSNATTGRPGWALTSEAIWLVYFVTPHSVLMFLLSHLRARLPAWRERFPERPARNEGYDTLGLCVPLRVALGAVEYVAHLDHGDGAILQPRTNG
jgi:hypothetical protein